MLFSILSVIPGPVFLGLEQPFAGSSMRFTDIQMTSIHLRERKGLNKFLATQYFGPRAGGKVDFLPVLSCAVTTQRKKKGQLPIYAQLS